ncbi:hypothetical protein FPV67DRAFT_1615879 [Lyophyllum atratum]|nr:hypothetical protein FPV67DRAFT_1615879 [Lyophyllum atratum]
MPQQSPNLAALNSPPDSGFVPRKEFIREQRAAPNSFAIVAIASSNFVRLYSFPPSVISLLRTMLETQAAVVAFREDILQNLCEFVLDGKPWASPKSVNAEKLLIDILGVIYHCGYTYLSSLDYGRENDDRLAMAFSRPSPLTGSRAGTPLPATASPFRESSASFSSDKLKMRRVPFALSFLSPTVMRVIAPPLHLTPAILQAVRASWPRGVISEKKVGDNSFEFKLKGYKWFQQDTFATDSLRLILSLLSSLDAQSFTLLASISLTNRSRVKDLWVFTGPGSPSTDDLIRQDSSTPSALNSSHGDIKRPAHSSESSFVQQLGSASLTHHRRVATEPNGSVAHPHTFQHVRGATEDGTMQFVHGYRQDQSRFVAASPPPMSSNPALLRKPAPRAQVPVSVVHEVDPNNNDNIRANLPSTISSGVEDMTGVGAAGFSPDVFYATSPFENIQTPAIPVGSAPGHSSPPKSRSATPPSRPRSPLRPVSTRAKTPPLLTSNPAPSSPPPPRPASAVGQQDSSASVPQLLGPGAFRDSAFSSNSDTIYEIPIKWTGIGEAFAQNSAPNPDQSAKFRPIPNRMSSVGPVLPSGWQPTPIEEKIEDDSGIMMDQPDSPTSEHNHGGAKTPIHEVASRITSPELTRPDMHLRKSEAALIGLIAERSPPPPMPSAANGNGSESPSSGSGQGWVLVNVEGTSAALRGESGNGAAANGTQPGSEHTRNSQAKAIVIMDAVDTKSKTKSKSQDSADPASPTKKRFFGLGRKTSKKVSTPKTNGISTPPLLETPKPPTSEAKPRSGFRDKFRLIGTPEAPRNEDKRRSLD